ncbi:hypothetical protein EWM64_g5974 [Hericium alpestre]|uniref:BTB domain-containing protein n=1 Tax=Hericium alpestre TaxID=135208 RepID=A0A4Y9ZX26_9AGAM|nr:hypothetical protein EWM64_g5974 [Hericium alpestre]
MPRQSAASAGHGHARDETATDASAGGSTQPALIKSAEFWLDDGNIILACGSTGFRAHQTVLAMHSSVFNDMFALGEPGPGDSVFEGCAVVEVTDSAEDILRMLKAVYFRDYATEVKQQLDVLASLLRMATKYMFDGLRSEVAAKLRLLFPDQWMMYASQERTSAMPMEFDPFVAVQLGQTCRLPAIVPVAMYLCVVREASKESFWQIPEGGVDTPREQLRHSCLRFMNDLKDRMDEVFLPLEDVLPWRRFANGRWACEQTDSRGQCAGLPCHARRVVERKCRILAVDIFRESLVFNVQDGRATCGMCHAHLTRYETLIQQDIWDLLPKLLGWYNWDAVKEEQRTLDLSERASTDEHIAQMPPRKCRREEAAEPIFEKDGEFWLCDGNIILVCELTGFCIHRSVLALHSAMFKGMLSDETLSAQQFEGRLVLALPNPAEDIHCMLKALYSRHYAMEQKQDFAVLASLLRMSSTYMLHTVRKEVISCLKILLPSTLSTYQSPERHVLLPTDFDPTLVVQLGEQYT